jgi:hypothetical protein
MAHRITFFRKVEQRAPRTTSKTSSGRPTGFVRFVPSVTYDFDPFSDLIVAYSACKKSIEDVKKLEPVRMEAESLRITVDEMFEKIHKRDEEDQEWRKDNSK